MRNIVHYVERDKFTAGYINFMNTVMTDYSHSFITLSKGFELDSVDGARIIYVATAKEVASSEKIRGILEGCHLFVVSGCFIPSQWALLPRRILRKTCFHFWGADFYGLRRSAIQNGKPDFKWLVYKTMAKRSFGRAGALAFLIDGEYEKFVEITGVRNRHFVAPMPGDPKKIVVYTDYARKKDEGVVRIIVGNSATEASQHVAAFHMLEKYKDENIEIICPLSYGNAKYGEYVEKEGYGIFGDKFKPVKSYMDKVSYVKLLAGCHIGINNCNRQQGMGNVAILLGTGAKVYIRSDTSMWDNYKDIGFTFYDVESIKEMSFAQFIETDESACAGNIDIQRKRLATVTERAKEQWSAVFENVDK